MIKTIFASLVLISLLRIGNAQNPQGYKLPSPLSAQFDKYINYPVDHSTGAASVDVPLYTIKAGSIQVPINLSYHTAGVKPDDVSLPIGLGWNLNPGARITRTMVKYPDEFYQKAPYQASYNPVTDLQLLQNMEYSPSGYWPTSNRNAEWDSEYDIFTYNTGTGVQGRFIIQLQGGVFVAIPLVLTRDKIQVHIGVAGIIDYIEVTDPQGTYFRFGLGLTSYSLNPSSFTTEYNTVNGAYNTAWMLTDIVSANKADTVSFIWRNVTNNVSNHYLKKVLTDKIDVTHQLIPWSGSVNVNDYTAFGYHHNDIGGPDQMDTYNPMNVFAGLQYKNQEIRMIFTTVVSSTVATAMEIYSQNIKQRQIDFQTSYFPSTTHRKLESVTIRDKVNEIINRYQFGYNEQIQLPGELSRAIDYWGYYNGHTSNSTLVPNFPYSVDKYYPQLAYTIQTGTNRSSNINASAFILNSITYPTGGKTTYEYENNQIYDPALFQAIPTGGLRIKKINHWSSDGQLAETRSYTYGVNECGYGDGVPMTAEMFVDETKTHIYRIGQQFQDFASYSGKNISNSPVNGMFMYLIPPVSYREITEYIGDATGTNSGKNVFQYSANPLPINSTFYAATSPYTYIDRYWQKPVLTCSMNFKNETGTYRMVSRQATNYIDYNLDSVKTWTERRYSFIKADPVASSLNDPRVYETNYNTWFQGTIPYIFQLYPVYLLRGIKVPNVERNVQYSPNEDSFVIEKTIGYANNDYLYPKTVTTVNSNGTSTVTNYTYPKDYVTGTSPSNTVAQGIKLLMDRNVVAPVIEEYTTVQPDNIVKSGKFTTFKTTVPSPDQIYELKAITTLGSFSPASITSSSNTKSSSYDLKATINLYDAFGNVRQATDESKGISTVVLYSYNGRFPIAIIENATFTSVAAAITNGQTGIDNFALGYPTNNQVTTFLSTLRTALPQALITSYTIDPYLGVTSQTDENGRTITYEYDAAGRLQIIRNKDGYIEKTFEYKYRQ